VKEKFLKTTFVVMAWVLVDRIRKQRASSPRGSRVRERVHFKTVRFMSIFKN
jgi:hypothetical protein